jgi:uncharacterized protein (TIGR01777 family)
LSSAGVKVLKVRWRLSDTARWDYRLDMESTTAGRRVILAGGSGFIGKGLSRVLLERGYDVVVLTRGDAHAEGGVRFVNWDARTVGPWAAELEGAAAIVNLVGKSVDCRKTEENRRVILESRVDSVRALGAASAGCAAPPPVWVQTATAHIYGDTGDEILDESSAIGEGFAPVVGVAWEKSSAENAPATCRTVVLRISFVLGRHGGALGTLSKLARWFLGGATGSGRQWISWIHEADLQEIILRAIENPEMRGVYVVTAPHPVTNAEFMREVRKAVGRPWSPPVPEVMVRIGARMMGTDPELALMGRRCVPARLIAEGFEFRFSEVEGAIADLVRTGGGERKMKNEK